MNAESVKMVAIGGGTGLPGVLRGMKHTVGELTAIVTVSDDGGSSGRLRRDMGIMPPGDFRNNIVALADDENLLARLFQYRFRNGMLEGHAFGNLFIAALAEVVQAEQSRGMGNALAEALTQIGNVLNIEGRVLPASLQDLRIEASVRMQGTNRVVHVIGESQIGEMNGQIISMQLAPSQAEAYDESVRAIQEADIITIGPGSLFTSILPNLLVSGLRQALLNSKAQRIYICNVATQPVETDHFSVVDHVEMLEQHVGENLFDIVLANDMYPNDNAGENTHYVAYSSPDEGALRNYRVHYTDLTDAERPWRHDPIKLRNSLIRVCGLQTDSTPGKSDN